MQTKKVDLYMTTTTNINAATFTFPYDNALSLSVSGTYNPIGLVNIFIKFRSACLALISFQLELRILDVHLRQLVLFLSQLSAILTR